MALRPQSQNSRNVSVPAPFMGLEANSPIFDAVEGMQKAVRMENLIPRELGCQVRRGSLEKATNLLDHNGQPGEVRTIIPFEALTGEVRLFATTTAGIYDITTPGAGPWTPVFEWAAPGDLAGWCSFINFTNVAGNHYLLLCDEKNGYHIYNGLTDTWDEGTITGGDPAATSLVHVTQWQNRIWFVQRDTGRAWYLPLGAIEGNPEPIDMGSRFIKGGFLQQLSTWTLDDGDGLDDKLIAISSSGDVLVFGGVDPDNASEFIMDGRWYVGPPPRGRRVMSNWGGDVLILSSFGIISASRLVSGERINEDSYLTEKISRYFRVDMKASRLEYGWAMEAYPGDGIVLISVPTRSSQFPKQFCMTINTRAWCSFSRLDMHCMSSTSIGFFFGTRDGRVLSLEGFSDNAPVDPDSEQMAESIKFLMLSQYDGLGTPGSWKRVHFIRPSFYGGAPPNFTVLASYDFDIAIGATIPPAVEPQLALWDEAIWDGAVWSGAVQSYIQTRGASGIGRQVALFMTGETATETSVLGFDLVFDTGGFL